MKIGNLKVSATQKACISVAHLAPKVGFLFVENKKIVNHPSGWLTYKNYKMVEQASSPTDPFIGPVQNRPEVCSTRQRRLSNSPLYPLSWEERGNKGMSKKIVSHPYRDG